MSNRERFEIALSATIYSTYCLTLTPEKISEHTAEFVDKVMKCQHVGGLPMAAVAACRVLGITPTEQTIRTYVAKS